ncbi:MAG: cysteine dioxygenase family protein [Myxococcales bacterium]
MSTFSIEDFAAGCKQAMAHAECPRTAAQDHLRRALHNHDRAEIVAALEAAIPAGASLGEMIVHQSPELTMLYARVPGHFRSGIHDHTVFACMGQLEGEERSVIYEQTEDGGLRVCERAAVTAGEVMSLPADAIHHIENPGDGTARSLHLYGGDFGALMDDRSLWSEDAHQQLPFSFEGLVQQAAIAMQRDGNDRGLSALTEAIPAAEALLAKR